MQRTARNIQEDLANVPHVRQRLQRIQSFLDDHPEGPPLVHKFPIMNLGAFEQTRDRLESRVFIKNDIRCVEHPREVHRGPLPIRLLRFLARLLQEIHLSRPPRTRPADLDD